MHDGATDADRLRVTARLSIPMREVAVRYDTSGGAGGQHANRSNTRVHLTFDAAASPSLGEAQRERIVARLGRLVEAVAADSRSQSRNLDLARERLAAKLAGALHVDPPRVATRPTKGSVRRRLDAKRRAGERKQLRRRPTADD